MKRSKTASALTDMVQTFDHNEARFNLIKAFNNQLGSSQNSR